MNLLSTTLCVGLLPLATVVSNNVQYHVENSSLHNVQEIHDHVKLRKLRRRFVYKCTRNNTYEISPLRGYREKMNYLIRRVLMRYIKRLPGVVTRQFQDLKVGEVFMFSLKDRVPFRKATGSTYTPLRMNANPIIADNDQRVLQVRYGLTNE